MKPLSSQTASDTFTAVYSRIMPILRVVEAKPAIHYVNWDGDRDRRHHPRRQDEKKQVIGQRHAKARKPVSGQRSEKRRENGRAEADDQRIEEALDDPRRTGDHHVAAAGDLLVPCLGRRHLGDEIVRLTRLHREQIDKSFERRREEHLRRIGDRVLLRLEGGRPDPHQRQNCDDGVKDDDGAGQPTDERRRLGERTRRREPRSLLLHFVERLHVDVGGAEYRDKQDHGER